MGASPGGGAFSTPLSCRPISVVRYRSADSDVTRTPRSRMSASSSSRSTSVRECTSTLPQLQQTASFNSKMASLAFYYYYRCNYATLKYYKNSSLKKYFYRPFFKRVIKLGIYIELFEIKSLKKVMKFYNTAKHELTIIKTKFYLFDTTRKETTNFPAHKCIS